MLDFRFLEPYSSRLLSVLRIVSGAAFLEHGCMKLLHFPAPMMPGALPPLLTAAGVLELVGGVLLILGLFTRLTAFILSGEMAIAYFMFHLPKGVYPAMNGGDAALLFCFIFLYLAAAGGGAWSLDNAMGKGAQTAAA